MAYLKGPADADHFRVKVGRYGDRWYHDPQPGCNIAPATDAVWPAFSIVKKASGKDWTFVGLGRVNDALEKKPHDLDGLTRDERYARLTAYNKTGLKAAGARGTGVHTFAEQLLLGQKPNRMAVLNKDAEAYLPALQEWFDQYQPELVAKEVVCINRTLNDTGYGCTSDAYVKIDGELYIIDWKSRGESSDHGAYPDEAAQVAANGRADYVITEHGRDILRPTGGLIVSIRPDGCRTYPIDIDKAWRHWTALHGWWVARRTEDDAIGKPLAPKGTKSSTPTTPTSNTSPTRSTTSPTMSPASASWDELTFDEPPKPSAASPAATTRLPLSLGGTTTPPPASTSPDEGVDVPQNQVDELQERFRSLTSEQREWCRTVAPFNVAQKPTLRRYRIGQAIIHFASLDADDEMIRVALRIVFGDEIQTSVKTKDALGTLTIEEAHQLRMIAVAIDKGGFFQFTDDGPKVVAA